MPSSEAAATVNIFTIIIAAMIMLLLVGVVVLVDAKNHIGILGCLTVLESDSPEAEVIC